MLLVLVGGDRLPGGPVIVVGEVGLAGANALISLIDCQVCGDLLLFVLCIGCNYGFTPNYNVCITWTQNWGIRPSVGSKTLQPIGMIPIDNPTINARYSEEVAGPRAMSIEELNDMDYCQTI